MYCNLLLVVWWIFNSIITEILPLPRSLKYLCSSTINTMAKSGKTVGIERWASVITLHVVSTWLRS